MTGERVELTTGEHRSVRFQPIAWAPATVLTFLKLTISNVFLGTGQAESDAARAFLRVASLVDRLEKRSAICYDHTNSPRPYQCL